MQFQADLLGVPVNRAANLETTALGAAYAAGLAINGREKIQAVLNCREKGQTFTPQMDRAKAKQLYQGWKRAVKHAQNWLAGA